MDTPVPRNEPTRGGCAFPGCRGQPRPRPAAGADSRRRPVGPRSSPFSLRAEALGTRWLLRPGWPLGLVCQQRRPAGARGWCVSGWLVGPAAPRAWPWAVRGGGPVGWGTSRTTRFPGAGPQQVPGHPCWCHSRGGGLGGRSGEPRGLTGAGAKRAAALGAAPGAGGAGGAGGGSLGASSRCLSIVGAGAAQTLTLVPPLLGMSWPNPVSSSSAPRGAHSLPGPQLPLAGPGEEGGARGVQGDKGTLPALPPGLTHSREARGPSLGPQGRAGAPEPGVHCGRS